MTNCYGLTTPVHDSIGIAFDPFLGAANHSCEPNVAVIMSGRSASMRALRPIAKDEEITVSYIDDRNPYETRQAQLRERYRFTCSCRKCVSHDYYDQSGPNYSKPEPSTFTKLDHARSDHTAPQAAIKICTDILRSRLSLPKPPPITAEPYAGARTELIGRLLEIDDLLPALRHSAKRYFDIDPVRFPQPFEPRRVTNAWALLRVILRLNDQPESPLTQELFVEQAFDGVVIMWRLIGEVRRSVGRSHGPGEFSDLVQRLEAEVKASITAAGGARAVGYVEQDPEGFWERFKGWKDEVDY